MRDGILLRSFYARDTVVVARDILGRVLVRILDGQRLSGIIVEAEAYCGEGDEGCHAHAGLTPRTATLFGPPGHAYVYFTYGMHHLVNFVTEEEGFPAAVLIRALRPEGGLERMRRRRGRTGLRDLTSGPSRLCQALGLDLGWNGALLTGPELVVRKDGGPPERIASGPRVGIRKGTDRPWRFWVEGDPFVSRARPGPARPRRRGSPGEGRNLDSGRRAG